MEAFCNEMTFTPFNGAVSAMPCMEDPPATINVSEKGRRNKSPGLILNKGLERSGHGILPFMMSRGHGIVAWFL